MYSAKEEGEEQTRHVVRKEPFTEERVRAWRLRCQNLYFCTSKASKLSTDAEGVLVRDVEGKKRRAGGLELVEAKAACPGVPAEGPYEIESEETAAEEEELLLDVSGSQRQHWADCQQRERRVCH